MARKRDSGDDTDTAPPDERGFFDAFGPIEPELQPAAAKPKRQGKLAADKPHHLGHRERLRERFRLAETALPDYEILELLLFRSIARADTKGTAKALIARFGSLAEVLGAPERLLREVPGVGESSAFDIKLVAAAASRMARGDISEREVLASWEAVLRYCRAAMAFEEKEHFRILFLDKKNGLIADEVQQSGTVDHTPVYPREVVKRALELSASAIVLVHNHPTTPFRSRLITLNTTETSTVSAFFADCVQGAAMANWERLKG